jgi:uncharacterized protein DUF1883/TIR domain-containing protein
VNFLQWDLGSLHGGEMVEVTLRGQAQNVELLDSSGFTSFKTGRSHRYIGGNVTRSPYTAVIPRAGHWYVVVHLGGYPGRMNAAVRVLPGALPRARTASPSALAPIMNAADEYVGAELNAAERNYDVFISHAGEDKVEVVRPLAEALTANGVEVWYDEFELKIGDILRRRIDAGLARSRFGIVVLSSAFFGKGWPNYELDGLVTREVSGSSQVILPIWHGVSHKDVLAYSPSLAAKLARSTADRTIDEIALEIADLVLGSTGESQVIDG